jgi:hypothetical protein
MAFGSGFNNFFNGVYEGLTTADDLKDYRHASKLFLSDGYALAPQTKFLFHVYFTLNTAEIPGLRNAFSSVQDVSTIGMMVKTADLPKFNIDVNEFNQYNRKRYVQGKINYDPVNITFHDDGSDLVRSMWNAYYSYYYQDSLHQYDGVTNADLSGTQSPLDFNRRDIYDNLRNVNNWGYDGAGNASGYKPNFFKDIKIFGMNRGNFTQYTLINPIITNWAHDQFDYSNGNGTMTNSVTLRYETVKYARGAIGSAGDSNVKGWGDPSTYDNEPSQFGKAGSVASITGAGGLLDAGASVIDDLASGNILGALVTGATAYETFSDFDFGAAFESEGTDVATSVLTAVAASPTVTNAVNNFVFPKPESTQNTQLPTAAATMSSNGGLTSSSNTTPPTNSNWLNPDLNFNNRASNPADVNSNGAPVNSQWVNPDE